jgi:hypothetical protein
MKPTGDPYPGTTLQQSMAEQKIAELRILTHLTVFPVYLAGSYARVMMTKEMQSIMNTGVKIRQGLTYLKQTSGTERIKVDLQTVT